MRNALIVLYKDWLEIRKQPGLLLGIFLTPLLLSMLLLVFLSQIGHLKFNTPLPGLDNPLFAGLSETERQQVALGSLLSSFFLLLPGVITSIIASYSIVGEKSSRTLEPLLATPIRTWELLLGKCLTSLVPGIAVTWFVALTFVIGTFIFSTSARMIAALISPGWLLMVLAWSPLLAVIAIAVMIAVSARVNEPRTAQQASAWLIVPFYSVLGAQLAGLQILGPLLALVIAAVLLVLAILAMWFVTLIFRRETILVRWK
ncbi:MAG: ABC transporter permease subunit [Ktedonobacteraceae bacterium]|nr:ABC transporter permease subunit [Ktedonobacteraceae bacterium]